LIIREASTQHGKGLSGDPEQTEWTGTYLEQETPEGLWLEKHKIKEKGPFCSNKIPRRRNSLGQNTP